MERQGIIKIEAEKLLQDAKDRQAAIEALTFLFPKLIKLLNVTDNQYPIADGGFSKHRISNSQLARSYFDLTPNQNVWGKSETNAMAVGNAEEAFVKFRARINQAASRDRAKIRRLFMDILSSITRDTTRPRDWFMAIIQNAHSLLNVGSETNLGLFDLEIDSQITFLLADILKPLSETERGAIISHAIDHSTDISFLCNVFRYFIGDLGPDGAKGQSPSAFGADTLTLRRRLVDKVVTIANSHKLYSQIRPQDILWFWWGSGHADAVRYYTSQGLDDPDKLRALLEIPINTVRSSAGNYEHINRRSWSKIVDLEGLHRRATIISREKDNQNFDVSRRFLAAYDRGDEDDF